MDEILRQFHATIDSHAHTHVHVGAVYFDAVRSMEFTDSDLPILLFIASRPAAETGYAGGMALAAMGRIDDPRALEVLLAADARQAGDRSITDAAYWGLGWMAEAPHHRKGMAAWLRDHAEHSERAASVAVLLAKHEEPAALQSLVALLEATAPRGSGWELPFDVELVLGAAQAWGEPSLAPALARYLERGGERVESAAIALVACGGTPDKEVLFKLLGQPRFYTEQHALHAVLGPMLTVEDGPRLATLLGAAHQGEENFYIRVVWMKSLAPAILRTEVLGALIELSQREPSMQGWALEAIAKADDPRAIRELERARDAGSTTALDELIQVSPDPWRTLRAAFVNGEPQVIKAAGVLIANRSAETFERMPAERVPAYKKELVEVLLPRLASAAPQDLPDGLMVLLLLVRTGVVSVGAERTPKLTADIRRVLDELPKLPNAEYLPKLIREALNET